MTTSLLATFKAAIAHGPVLVVAPMLHPNHLHTQDPLVDNSPLVRAALLATDLGARRLVFSASERHSAVIYLTAHGSSPAMLQVVSASKTIPAVGFYWCSLNAGFFCHEIAVWGERLSATLGEGAEYQHLLGLPGPIQVAYDERPAHAACIAQVLNYFHSQGWLSAADRLAAGHTTAAAPLAAADLDAAMG